MYRTMDGLDRDKKLIFFNLRNFCWALLRLPSSSYLGRGQTYTRHSWLRVPRWCWWMLLDRRDVQASVRPTVQPVIHPSNNSVASIVLRRPTSSEEDDDDYHYFQLMNKVRTEAPRMAVFPLQSHFDWCRLYVAGPGEVLGSWWWITSAFLVFK